MGRYAGTPKIMHQNHETLGRFHDYPWLVIKPNDSQIKLYKVTTKTAGDSRRISQAIYGNHNLFWVLSAFNSKWYADAGAMNVFGWPAAGQIIYYPTFSVISATIT